MMSGNKQIKQFAYKAGLFALISGSVIINEQLLLHKLEKQNKNFNLEKTTLQNKISELEKREERRRIENDTSFRFYKHLRDGIDYKEFEAIDTLSFRNTKENPFEQYRPQRLTKELVEQNDSLLTTHQSYDKLLNEQEKYYQAMNDSNSITTILQNGQLFLQSLLNTMSQHNHELDGRLIKIIDNSDEKNDREFKARYFMFQIKTKNKMYPSRYKLKEDFYHTIFLKNVSVYRRTAKQLTQIVDSLDAQYKDEIKQDSLAFEYNKKQRIDSLLNSKPQPIVLPKFTTHSQYNSWR
ncbi:MAG: hypothetical protein IJX20_03305 [Alphaproteobacteria bacterium]|nr:hypothetical protein [Alphaproteobacteria bacterium]